MRKSVNLWKKRMVLLLAIALLTGEISSVSAVSAVASVTDTSASDSSSTEKVPVPEEYYTLGEEGASTPVFDTEDLNAEKEAQEQEEIPVISPTTAESLEKAKEEAASQKPEDQADQQNVQTPEQPQAQEPNQLTFSAPEEISADKAGETGDVSGVSANTVELDKEYTMSYDDFSMDDSGYSHYVISFTPEEDGYYALKMRSSDVENIGFSCSTQSENGTILNTGDWWMNQVYLPSVNKLNAGTDYRIILTYSSTAFNNVTYCMTKVAETLAYSNGVISGEIGSVGVLPIEIDQAGELYKLYLSHRTVDNSAETFHYTIYDLDNNNSWSCDFSGNVSWFWECSYSGPRELVLVITKNSEEKMTLNTEFHYVPIVTWDSQKTVEKVNTYTYSADEYTTEKRVILSFTPTEDGVYLFKGEGITDSWVSRITRSESSESEEWMEYECSSSDRTIEVTLEAGKEYYFYGTISKDSSTAIPNQINVSIQKESGENVALGQKKSMDITGGVRAVIVQNSEKGKFYRVSVQSSDVDDKYFVWSPNDSQEWEVYGTSSNSRTHIFYANEKDLRIIIDKHISTGWDGQVSLLVEEYIPEEMELTKVLKNNSELEAYESYITSFTTPKNLEQNTDYSFWGIEYADAAYGHYGLLKEDGGLTPVEDVTGYSGQNYFNDEYNRQYTLEPNTTYYLYQYMSDDVKKGDYLVCVEKAESYSHDFSEGNKVTWNINLYKSAKVDITVPESGFYEIVTDGDSETGSYQFRDNNYEYFTVYNKQPKQVYISAGGTYTLQVSREFKKESTVDPLKLTIKKAEALKEIPLYGAEENPKANVSLREYEDYQWMTFTAQEAGYYLFRIDGDEEDEDCYLYSSKYRMEGNRLITANNATNVYGTYMLSEGEKLYVKVLTDGNGGDGYISAVKCQERNLSAGITDTFTSKNGYDLVNADVQEAGMYRLKVSAVGEETYLRVYTNRYNYYAEHSVTRNVYMPKGKNPITISSEKGEEITVSVTKIEENTCSTEIPINGDKDEVWIKYIPDTTGKQAVAFDFSGASKNSYDVEAYCLNAEYNYLEGVGDELKATSKEKERYIINDFVQEKTYFLKVSFNGDEETLAGTLSVVVEDVSTKSTSLDKEVTVGVDRFAQIEVSNEEGKGCTRGWYQVTIEGNAVDYRVDLNYGSFAETSRTLAPNSSEFFMLNKKGTISLFLTKTGDFENKEDIKVTVTRYNGPVTELRLRENVSRTGASNLECYTFNVPESGIYKIDLTGIKQVYYRTGDLAYNKWKKEGTVYLNEGSQVEICVPNMKGKDYQLKLYDVITKYLFDADQYEAFLASGGTVDIISPDSFETEWDWQDFMIENWEKVCETGDMGTCLFLNTSKFKNQNDIWYPEPLDSKYFETTQNTYADFADWPNECINTKKQTFLGFYKTNGQKASLSEKLENPYYLLAKYAPKYVWVQEITLTGVNALKVGQSETLKATLNTKNKYLPTNPSVTWSSSDSSVISVDQNGKMTAKKEGSAIVKVTSQDQLGKSASLKVTVFQDQPGKNPSPDVVYVTKVTITGDNKAYVGEEIQLKATLETGGKGKPSRDGVTWSTSDATVATVDQNGKVKAICAGTVTITAASKDGKAKATYSIKVENIVEKKITLNESSIIMKKGTTYKWLKVTFKPANTTIKTLKWKTSNSKVATVNSKGVITAKGVGKATITVTSANGKKDTVKVTVTTSSIKVKKLTMTKKLTMKLGDKENLKPEFEPINATNQKLEWKSSNENVAKVNSKGQVTAVGAGKANITCTTKDGSKKKATCEITVKGVSDVKNVKITDKTKNSLTVTWKAAEDVDGYEIYMATSKKGTYKKVATVDDTKTSFIKKKLTKNKNYYFKVRAYKTVNGKKVYGDYSSVKSGKTKK